METLNNQESTAHPTMGQDAVLNHLFKFSVIKNSRDTCPIKVEKTWYEFLTSLLAEPRENKALSLEEYQSANNETRTRIKNGPAWIPAVFTPDGNRVDANVMAMTAAVLDFDDGAINFDAVESHLNGWTFAAHTSFSHTPEKPKLRVIVPFSKPAEPALALPIFEYFDALFGGHCDPARKNPSGLFYLPACPYDASGLYHHMSRIGKLFDPAILRKNGVGANQTNTRKPDQKIPAGENPIIEGGRNKHLTSLAGSMRRRGMSETAILAALCEENKIRCNPPLPDKELKTIARSVGRYSPSGLNGAETNIEKPQQPHPSERDGLNNAKPSKPTGKNRQPESDPSQEDDDPWGEPILFDQVFFTPEIDPSGIFPGVYGEYAKALSENFQTPSALAASMVLSILSTALAGKFEIRPYPDDSWIEPLMTWTLAIAETGEGKSQVLSRCIKPLDHWQILRRKAEKEAIEQNNTKRWILVKRAEKLAKEAVNEEDEQARNDKEKQSAKLKESMPNERFETKLYTNEATPESAQDMLAKHGGKMAFLNDEGGLLQVMAGVYSGGNVITDVFLKGYNGMSVKVNRRCREVDIPQANITIGLAIQPGILNKYPKAVWQKFCDSGLFGRFFVFYPVSTIGKRDVRKHSKIPDELQQRYERAVMSLLDIEPENGGTLSLTLGEEAREAWLWFSDKLEKGQANGGEYEEIKDWAAKMRGGVLRLAGLFHVAELERFATDMTVSKDNMVKALDLMLLLIDHTRAFLGLSGHDKPIEDAKAVWAWIEREKLTDFKGSKAHNKFNSRFPRVEELEEALDVLKGRELLHGPYEKSNCKGRPSKQYRVNPKALRV